MSTYTKLIVFVVIAYFIGNISPATILGRINGIDIKKEGSGNAGTTNVLRVLGWKAALITLVIDIAKGTIAVALGTYNCGMAGAMLCFIAVVYGHIYPVLLKFKGGKGVATAFGAAWAINWPSAFAVLGVAAISAALSKKMSVGSIAAAIAYPLLILYYYPRVFLVSVLMAVTLLFTHRSNIRRLFNGEEKELTIGGEPDSGAGTAEGFTAPRHEKKDDNEVKTSSSNFPISDELMNADLEMPLSHPDVKVDGAPKDFYEDEIPVILPADKKKKVAVIGNGSFGCAIANVAAHNGHSVMVYGRNREAIDEIRDTRENRKYLPGVLLHEQMHYTVNIRTAAGRRDFVIFAVPAQQFRSVAARVQRHIDRDTILVNLAKGIERGTDKTMSQIAEEVFGSDMKYVALSGPSHAEEIARNYPASVVVASKDHDAAKAVQDLLMSSRFRVYTSDDVTGVELGGALKNVIAIGTGIADGMEFGDSTKAAFMTRGIHEITKLGTAMGAKSETFAGLSGIGDLLVTCQSDLSRNRRCGILIGKGMSPDEAVKKIGTTVEGFYTVDGAIDLAKKYGVEMPITEAVSKVLAGTLRPRDAVELLMEREKKDEVK
jgi:glycerol-3-phosphate dehydrogenase (NAD(P)+)